MKRGLHQRRVLLHQCHVLSARFRVGFGFGCRVWLSLHHMGTFSDYNGYFEIGILRIRSVVRGQAEACLAPVKRG